MNDDLSSYLSGERLYGDDFTVDEIRAWFADEAEGYANLGAGEKERYCYAYHALNAYHAFRFFGDRRFDRALGLGSAYGHEFRPIAERLGHVTILDPSDAFSDVTSIFGTPCRYIKPTLLGDMPFEDGHFDLVTSLGVLHHIPNVSHVLGECHRCLAEGGVMLLREPVVSMGDWRRPRRGLTRRERGIPLEFLDERIRHLGFQVRRRALCVFPLVPKIVGRFGMDPYNHPLVTRLDALLSRWFAWNVTYHRTTAAQKLAPASVYFVLEK